MKLLDLFNDKTYFTDKGDLGYIEHFYDSFLKKFQNTPIVFMEIGAFYGESIKLWKDYFHPNSIIFASDINYFEHLEGTYSILGDMYSDKCIDKLPNNYFDLIIDDGPHTFESFVLLITKYFSKIRSGGTLIVEDIINPLWVEPLVMLSKCLGYSSCEVIDMTGKQKTDNLLDMWKNGLYILNITK